MIPQDPFILLSFINTKLRDEFDSLQSLCNSLDINSEELQVKLASIGFEYVKELNTFK